MNPKEIKKLLIENAEIVTCLKDAKERIYQVRLTMKQWRELMKE